MALNGSAHPIARDGDEEIFGLESITRGGMEYMAPEVEGWLASGTEGSGSGSVVRREKRASVASGKSGKGGAGRVKSKSSRASVASKGSRRS